MNKDFKYDPEDIESLMLHKHFTELLPDEREFVLKHLDSEAEYEHLRETLLQSMDAFSADEFTPPPALKQDLMNQFKQHHRQQPIWTVWLNSLFTAAKNRPFYAQPAFQLASLSVVLFVGGYFLFNQVEKEPVAVEQFKSEHEEIPEEALSNIKFENEITTETEVTDEVPAAPVEIEYFESEKDVSEVSTAQKQVEIEEDKEVFYDAIAETVVEEEETQSRTTSFAPAAANSAMSNDMLMSITQEKPISIVNESLLDLLFAAR